MPDWQLSMAEHRGKLYRSTVTYAGSTVALLTNYNECMVCRRSAHICDAYPWPNHDFIPANCAEGNVPPKWQGMEIVTANPPERLI